MITLYSCAWSAYLTAIGVPEDNSAADVCSYSYTCRRASFKVIISCIFNTAQRVLAAKSNTRSFHLCTWLTAAAPSHLLFLGLIIACLSFMTDLIPHFQCDSVDGFISFRANVPTDVNLVSRSLGSYYIHSWIRGFLYFTELTFHTGAWKSSC